MVAGEVVIPKSKSVFWCAICRAQKAAQSQPSKPTKEERWKPKVRESNQSVAEDAAKLDEPSWMPKNLQKHNVLCFLRA